MRTVTAQKRQESFRTVTWNLTGSGREQFGTVFSLRENDDAVGCDAPARNFPKTLRGSRRRSAKNFYTAKSPWQTS